MGDIKRTRRQHARLAYVMRVKNCTLLCVRFGKVFGALPHPATITYNAKASVLEARQHVLQSLVTRIATRLTIELQPTARASLVRCICPAQQNSVAAPCTTKRNKKACSTIARAARSNEPFHIARTGGLRTDGRTNKSILVTEIPGKDLTCDNSWQPDGVS